MVPVTPILYLQSSLDRLREAVLDQNRIGSVEGLLAHHILKDDQWIKIEWRVGCTQEWIDTVFQPTNLDHISALGYMIWLNPTSGFHNQLQEGLSRVRERDAFKGEHLCLARNPSRLLGIILGSIALCDVGYETLLWCQEVLKRMQDLGMTDFDPLVQYCYFRALSRTVSVPTQTSANLYQMAFNEWAIRQGIYKNQPSQQQMDNERQQILFRVATDLHFNSASQAAFIWTSVNSILFQALGTASLQPRHVAAILRNFESAMKRWRWDGDDLAAPIRWPVTQEREVQDILWLILRSYFSDVVDEDALPKLGHSTYKADFGIGSLKLIIEAKFAYTKNDFKKIEKEVQEDCIPYLRDLRYESLIVFIYDDSASVQEHDTTRNALLEIPGIADVVIVSRPSQLLKRKSTKKNSGTRLKNSATKR